VTVVVNPGTTVTPAPLTPTLERVEVRLVTTGGAVLASASNTQAGAVVTLNEVVLPANGSYRIQILAPAAQGDSTGNYLVTFADATADEQRLPLNEPVIDRVESAFAVDRWRFIGTAGQQVEFDLLNAAPAVLFRLTGPTGNNVFNDVAADTGLISLPQSGEYVLTAYGSESGDYAFRFLSLTISNLSLNTPYNGTVSGSGQSQLFRVQVTAATPLRFTFDDTNADNRHELYISHVISPSRSVFQFQAVGTDPEILVPLASPGVWNVLVYSDAVPAPGAFSLTATARPILINGVTPGQLSNAAESILTVTGAGFVLGTTVQLVAADGTIIGGTVQVDGPERLTARFAVGIVPTGTYSVRLRRPDGTQVQLDNAFEMVGNGAPLLETNMVLPRALGNHIFSTLYVEYANRGTIAMPAPVLVLSASNRALMTLDQPPATMPVAVSGRASRGDGVIWLVGYSDTVQILAQGDTPGLLQPGESVRVPVTWVGRQQPWTPEPINFTLTVSTQTQTDPLDWNSVGALLKPSHVTAEAWAAVLGNLRTLVGNTWGDYVRMLDDNATYLGQLGRRVIDVRKLLAFQLELASGMHPLAILASGLDAAVEAPGLGLSLGRTYANSILGHYDLGIFGRGWRTPWEERLTFDTAGNAEISGPGMSRRRFKVPPYPGFSFPSFSAMPGDHGDFSAAAGGYNLRESDGLLRHFHADGKLDYLQDLNGNRISAVYSGNQLTRLVHSSGQFLNLTYNAQGRVSSIADSEGETTRYTYDAPGEHLLSVQYADTRTVQYTYSTGNGPAREHALTSIQGPSGVRRFFTYDTAGRLDRTFLDGNVQQVDFVFARGGQIGIRDATGTSQVFFDNRGQVVRLDDALGRTTRWTYDEQLNLTGNIDALGFSVSLANYDTHGNPGRITDELGQVTSLTYISPVIGARTARLRSLTDARGNTTTFHYDARANLRSTNYADGTSEKIVADALGNVETSTDQRSRVMSFITNTAGQVTRKTYADGSTVDAAYDARNNLASLTDSSGILTFSYDAGDRLTRVSYPNGRALDYTYDSAGRRIRMVDQTSFTVNYTYDSLSRLATLTDAADNLIVRYSYDAVGRLFRKDLGNGGFTTYDYDSTGQMLLLINHAPGGTIDSRFAYTYDAVGRRETMTTLDGVWNYEYDPTGQLTHAAFVSTNPAVAKQDMRYIHDAVGNRLQTVINGVTTDYVTNNMNQYVQVGADTYNYDPDGNLISITTAAGGTFTFTYNQDDLLTGTTTPTDTWNYEYDPLGNRRATIQGGQRTEYLIDPTGLGHVVGEYTNAAATRYVHGFGLVSRFDLSGVSNYEFDALGSVVGLAGANGSVLNRYAYTPFGERLLAQETVANPFQFVGQLGVMHEGNGLEFMRARFYAPVPGRFLSLDPLRPQPQSLYAYAQNNPLTLVDPTGLIGVPTGAGLPPGAAGFFLDPTPSNEDTWAQIQKDNGYDAANQNKRENPNDPRILEFRNSEHYWFARESARDSVVDGLVVGLLLTPGYSALKILGYGKGETSPPSWDEVYWGFRGMWDGLFGPPPDPNQPGDDDDSQAAQSADPNAKTGPASFGPSGFVRSNALLPYRIDFENDAEATAPAQRVDVVDQLDARFDWDTFTFTEVGFGDIFLAVPEGSRYFRTSVAMNYNNKDFEVEIELSFDSLTGRILASFQAFDPLSYFPLDVLTGFLPPEDGTGRGMGHFSYTVRVDAGLASGTAIRNVATIQFDFGEIIDTNQVDPHDPTQGTDPNKEALITLDAGAPTSSVLPLPATVDNPAFNVSWSGTDDTGGSGIGTFDVFVSTNGGPFTLFRQNTPATSAVFQGARGQNYAFYSVATDNVGRRQDTTTAAQATVTVRNLDTGVTQEGGVLIVAGSSNDDRIELTTSRGKLLFKRNGIIVSRTIPVASFQEVRVFGLEGDDAIIVSNLAKPFTFDGDVGTDTLTFTAPATTNTFRLEATAVNFNGLNLGLVGIENLVINGGKRSDTLTVAALPAFPVTFKGGTGKDTLVGLANAANTFRFNNLNAGTFNDVLNFLAVESLTGGNNADRYIFGANRGVSGILDGLGGEDILDYAAFVTPVQVDLAKRKATRTGGIVNLERVVGGASTRDTLKGANTSNVWHLTDINGGDVNGFFFSGFEFLFGGRLDDVFNIDEGKGVTGGIRDGRLRLPPIGG
jgi:RHS repeat-associated protein